MITHYLALLFACLLFSPIDSLKQDNEAVSATEKQIQSLSLLSFNIWFDSEIERLIHGKPNLSNFRCCPCNSSQSENSVSNTGISSFIEIPLVERLIVSSSTTISASRPSLNTLPHPVYAVEPPEKFVLSLNMARLDYVRPGYRYRKSI